VLGSPVTVLGKVFLKGWLTTNDCNLGVDFACIFGSVGVININFVLPRLQIVIPDLLVAFIEVLF